MKRFESLKENQKLRKVSYAIATAALSASAMAPLALAQGPKDIVQTFLGYVIDMFICIGALLGVWAIAQLALAFKNEDADSKSRAMMMLIVAAVLIGITGLSNTVLNGTNLTPGNGFLMAMPGLGL